MREEGGGALVSLEGEDDFLRRSEMREKKEAPKYPMTFSHVMCGEVFRAAPKGALYLKTDRSTAVCLTNFSSGAYSYWEPENAIEEILKDPVISEGD